MQRMEHDPRRHGPQHVPDSIREIVAGLNRDFSLQLPVHVSHGSDSIGSSAQQCLLKIQDLHRRHRIELQDALAIFRAFHPKPRSVDGSRSSVHTLQQALLDQLDNATRRAGLQHFSVLGASNGEASVSEKSLSPFQLPSTPAAIAETLKRSFHTTTSGTVSATSSQDLMTSFGVDDPDELSYAFTTQYDTPHNPESPTKKRKSKPDLEVTYPLMPILSSESSFSSSNLFSELPSTTQSTNISTSLLSLNLSEPSHKFLDPAAASFETIPSDLSFPMQYEITRVALSFGMAPSQLLGQVTDQLTHTGLAFDTCSYDQFWTACRCIARDSRKLIPPRSSNLAWETAQLEPEHVEFSASLEHADAHEVEMFRLRLKPLKFHYTSNRLARKCGGANFISLSLPQMSGIDLPDYVVEKQTRLPQWWFLFLDFLTSDRFLIINKTWGAFYVKPESYRKKKTYHHDTPSFRLFLYAECADSEGIHSRQGAIQTVSGLLRWLLPFEKSATQFALKYFARIQLGVSDTTPTIAFSHRQIVRTRDRLAGDIGPRNLARNRLPCDPSLATSPMVMNDGCARISRAAAAIVSDILELDYVPAAFQARLGGAKGMWLVDPLDELLECSSTEGPDNIWIEVCDSQLKYDWHDNDALSVFDHHRCTFEVHAFSKKVTSSALHTQFLPILIHNGVPLQAIDEIVREDVQTEVSALRAAMEDPLQCRKWIQEQRAARPVISSSDTNDMYNMVGGLPRNLDERIMWFLDHGFEPLRCHLLNSCCFQVIKNQLNQLEAKSRIGIARSTTAYMIPDPLGVLEEGEIHVKFSREIRDPLTNTNFSDLHNIDVLVTRTPAYLASDFQKIRAVYKAELRSCQDVIVFSTKGQTPLAHVLSGGDYDGDRAFICWDERIVKNFRNFELPKAPEASTFGILKDTQTVGDLLQDYDDTLIQRFLRKAFEFNLTPQTLGYVSNYHEAWCYHNQNAITSPTAERLAWLCGYLVDAAKGGFQFSQNDWRDYMRRNGLPKLDTPAYKSGHKPKNVKHFLDRLRFETIRGLKETALKELANLGQGETYDQHLTLFVKAEEEWMFGAGYHKASVLMQDLYREIDKVADFWHEEARKRRQALQMTTKTLAVDDTEKHKWDEGVVNEARRRFLAIKPLAGHEPHWYRAGDSGDLGQLWYLLKASALYRRYYRQEQFVWQICGKELGELKLRALGRSETIDRNIVTAMKVDRKFMARQVQTEQTLIDEDDPFESDVFDEWDGTIDGTDVADLDG